MPTHRGDARPPRAHRSRRRILLLAGLGLLAYVISRYPFATIANACSEVGPAVLVTPLIAIGWFAGNSAALGIVIDGRVPLRSLLWNRLIGEGFNSLIPAAGVGGEPFKLRHLMRFVSKGAAAVALINDYIIENAVALVSSAAFLAIGVAALELPPAWRDGALLYVAIASALAALGTLVVVSGVPSRIGGRFQRWLPSIPEGARVRPRRFVRAALWCLIARMIGVVEIALLLWALDIDPTPLRLVFLAGWTAAAGFLALGIPQGLGVTDAATVMAFELLHLPGPAGVAFSLARRGRMLFMSLLGVGLHVAFDREPREGRVPADEERVTSRAAGAPAGAPPAEPADGRDIQLFEQP
jgi:hypothetical protein